VERVILNNITNPIIELKGIYTTYEGADRPVIRDASLSLDRGEFVIVGGPNGAGKTTLLESINGMLPIIHGTGRVFGMDIKKRGYEIRKRVGYVLQNFEFDPLTPFTVEQVILMGRYGLLGWLKRPREEDYIAVESAIHLLGIEDLALKAIGKLSGGQQQKVLIAQNIARKPEVLLLDEPFSNIDLYTRDFISNILRDVADAGCTVIMVSHAFDGLPDHILRIIAMNNGSICINEQCRADEVEESVRKVCMVE
jgi:zinc/manganese transport system ATP-binding protein